jgi:hypothetical protein
MPGLTTSVSAYASAPYMSRPSYGAGAPAVGVEDGAQRHGEVGKVAVVDPAVVQLAREFAEESGPVAASGDGRDADLDVSFDHLDRNSSGGGGPRLFPGAVSTSG